MPPTEVPRLPPPAPARRESRPLFGQRQSSGELAIQFKWPVKLARTVALGLAVSWLALGLLSGASLSDSFREAGYVLVISFMVLITLLPLGSWAIQQAIELKRVQRESPRPQPRQRKESFRPLAVNGYPRRKAPVTREKQLEKLLARIGGGMRNAADQLLQAPPPRQRGRTVSYSQSAQAPVARVASEPARSRMWDTYKEVYQMTRLFHTVKPTRENFELQFPGLNGQKMYVEWRDRWVMWGWVELNGRKEIKDWLYDEHVLYAGDRNLMRVAQEMGFKFPEGGQ